MCSERLRMPRARRGFTLVEMLLAIVVIGFGVAGVLMAFDSTVKRSADPVVDKQLLAIAEEMMEEIELQPFSSPSTKVVSGCARSGFVKVLDYNDYTTTNQICDVDGAIIAGLSGYSVEVKVVSEAFNGVGASDALKITVTAKRGTDQFKLVSWRTNFAG